MFTTSSAGNKFAPALDLTMAKTESITFPPVWKMEPMKLENGSRERVVLAVEAQDEVGRIQQAPPRDYQLTNPKLPCNRFRDVPSALRRGDLGTFGVCVGSTAEI